MSLLPPKAGQKTRISKKSYAKNLSNGIEI
jgi:hypothetical protein